MLCRKCGRNVTMKMEILGPSSVREVDRSCQSDEVLHFAKPEGLTLQLKSLYHVVTEAEPNETLQARESFLNAHSKRCVGTTLIEVVSLSILSLVDQP